METVHNIIEENRQQLKSILAETRRQAILELIPKDEMIRDNDIEIVQDGTMVPYYDKRRQSSEQIYKKLTQDTIDNIGKDFHLSFGRVEADDSTTDVHFYFTEVILLTDSRVVLQGNAKMSRCIQTGKNTTNVVQIDYKFDKQQFYEAVYCKNNTVRDMKELSLDIAGINGQCNIRTVNKLIHFLTLCYYSR